MKFTTPATFIQSISCHLGSWSMERCAGVLAWVGSAAGVSATGVSVTGDWDHLALAVIAADNLGTDAMPSSFNGGGQVAGYPVNCKQRKSFIRGLFGLQQLARLEQSPLTLDIISERFRQLRSGRYRLTPIPLT